MTTEVYPYTDTLEEFMRTAFAVRVMMRMGVVGSKEEHRSQLLGSCTDDTEVWLGAYGLERRRCGGKNYAQGKKGKRGYGSKKISLEEALRELGPDFDQAAFVCRVVDIHSQIVEDSEDEE